MKITLPKGFEIPGNAKPGEPFEVVATVVAAEDGTFDLTAVDGVELPSEAPAAPEPAPEEMGYKMPGENETLGGMIA